jgi:hypothetical protein
MRGDPGKASMDPKWGLRLYWPSSSRLETTGERLVRSAGLFRCSDQYAYASGAHQYSAIISLQTPTGRCLFRLANSHPSAIPQQKVTRPPSSIRNAGRRKGGEDSLSYGLLANPSRHGALHITRRGRRKRWIPGQMLEPVDSHHCINALGRDHQGRSRFSSATVNDAVERLSESHCSRAADQL